MTSRKRSAGSIEYVFGKNKKNAAKECKVLRASFQSTIVMSDTRTLRVDLSQIAYNRTGSTLLTSNKMFAAKSPY